MDTKTLFAIQIITLFDSICFGLIYAFINPYILIVGGNHLIVGIFSVLNLICQLISPDFMSRIIPSNTGKQFSLFLVSVAATISYLLIPLTNSYWVIIFSRLLFTITNITNSLCKDILILKIPKDETEYFLSIHNVLSSCGYIIGPIITGCLFSHGFLYSCLLAAILTFGNVWLSTTLTITDYDEANKSEQEQSLVDKKAEEIAEVVKNFHDSDLQENWDVITLKFLFVSSISIFFTKFTQIMQNNFKSDAVVIGYTSSYMNGLLFTSPYLVKNIREATQVKEYLFTSYAFCTLLFSLICICYAPVFPLYLLLCIPLIFSRCYLNTFWRSLFASRKNEALFKTNEYIGIIAGCTIPIVFGIICDLIGYHAVILFSVLPIMFSILIFHKCTKWEISITDEKENLQKKDE